MYITTSVCCSVPKPWFILFVCSADVVSVTAIPESMLAGLYTANRNTIQMLLGRRPGIVTELVSELRFSVLAKTKLFI